MTTVVSAGSRVLAALDAVRDPELNESITVLGFVSECEVSPDGEARVTLRLPTYFCAPNFAYLMVADAYDVVCALPGIRSTRVRLEDHFAADAINEGVAGRAGFVRSFSGEAVDELDQLRADFLRKAVLAGTDQVCRLLVDSGVERGRLAAMRLGEVPDSPALQRLRRRRSDLGLPFDDDSPLLIDPVTGEAIGIAAAPLHLARARVVRVGVEANTGICRGMLRHRYQAEGLGEAAGEADDDVREEDR